MNWIDFYNNLVANTKNKSCQNGAMFTVDRKVYQRTFDDINSKMKFGKDDVVLDVGCGNGEIAKFIAPFVGKMVLIDGASNMLEFARQSLKNFTNVEFSQTDINKNIDFSALGRFDKIICYSVVHYLDNYQRFESLLQELIKALNPRGRILVGDIPLVDKREKYLLERKKKVLLNLFGNIKHFSKKTITNFLTAKTERSSELKDNMRFDRKKIMSTIEKLQTNDLNLNLVEQRSGLPFFNSREDLLVIKEK